MPDKKPTNEEIAQLLEEIADLLEAQEANVYRVRAYRNGAASVRQADRPLAELALAGDVAALEKLPDIGQGLAGTIIEYVRTGRSNVLDRLHGELSPAYLFTKVPGIGQELAERIANQLEIHSLEELEQAAYDGRLEKVEGFGPRRVKAVQVGLAGMLGRQAQQRQRRGGNG
ncbi:MAG: helix-hairpin-helix domain-containing protein, partial [Chloroflexi bacterium]|nr:helix-hairpin-helix domain-containing protein [Chloroflexota bacterium]